MADRGSTAAARIMAGPDSTTETASGQASERADLPIAGEVISAAELRSEGMAAETSRGEMASAVVMAVAASRAEMVPAGVMGAEASKAEADSAAATAVEVSVAVEAVVSAAAAEADRTVAADTANC
jgi:hypothetical protein